MPKYDIGIPAFNEAKTVEASVRSAFAQSVPPQSVYVCTNGCTDRTVEIVEKLAREFPLLVPLQSIRGKGNAWNTIFARARSPYLFFLDADVTANPSAAEEMLKAFDQEPKLVIVGGGSWRLAPAHVSLFSRVYDVPHGTLDTQHFLNGKIYMIRRDELEWLARVCAVPLLPPDVINDDHFLEKLSRCGGGFRVIPGAYAECHPITSFRDWLLFRIRVSRGRRQLMERYPQLFPDSDFWQARLRNHFHRFAAANTFLKKAGSICFAVMKESIQLAVYLDTRKEWRWARIESTKRALPSE